MAVQKLMGFLRLMRLANIVTAISDILAGVAISGYFLIKDTPEYSWQPVLLLVLTTIGLYGGGVVFNDVFDAELDAIERPERPIPSGLISKTAAASLGGLLLLLGIAAAAFVHPGKLLSISFILTFLIAAGALVYDKWTKHNAVLGPLNMGLCRGLNLLLGMSIVPDILAQYWYISLVPVLYIAAITMISRGEVHGGNKNALYAAAILYAVVIAGILVVSYVRSGGLYAWIFAALLYAIIFPPLQKAIRQPKGAFIGKAVKSGVIALIVMNAAWAAAFGMPYTAIFILCLLPVSLLLARLFAVT